MKLRPYQTRSIESTRQAWRTSDAVLLVAPTGAGKTVLGQELCRGFNRVLWVAHRRELVIQTAERLRSHFRVGIQMGGEASDEIAEVQVGTVQTLLASKKEIPADLVVLDEAHHYMAGEWRGLLDRFPGAKTLGLTATPERQDGEPLGDIFQEMVVAATYEELLADGFLVHSVVSRPNRYLGSDLAQDPLEAWKQYSENSQTFAFCARVESAYDLAQRFRDHGVIAETIEAETSKRERDRILDRFRCGKTQVLTNVNTLTEGVDVPEARCVLMCRSFYHVGGFLQAAGRVLRPFPDKPNSIIIDLTGATLRHGLPTDNRVYSLEGRAISSVPREHFDVGREEFSQDIVGEELTTISSVPGAVMSKAIELEQVDWEARRAEYDRLLTMVREHRMRDGFAAVKYREKFGEEPKGEWNSV